MSAKGGNMPSKKSIFSTYVLWLFGGIFGWHHFYLGRDIQAFVWWTTLGGYGIGWLGDVVKIPRYVRDANEDPKHMKEVIKKMLQNKKPPFSINRFTGMLVVAYTWSSMLIFALPSKECWGINFRYLNCLMPLVTALGVWAVGNIGREQGKLKWPLLAAYLAYPVRYIYYDESIWMTAVLIAASLAFDTFSKRWRRKPPKHRHVAKRIGVLAVCGTLYLSLWASYLYFNGTITDNDGEEIPIYQTVHYLFTTQWWLDVNQFLVDTYNFAQHNGWREIWNQLVDLANPQDEQNAYNVLGLGPDASQQEVTSRWRQLSKENHPDKAKPENRQKAQEKFMEIQRAYEILSVGKHRRNRQNKKDNSDSSAPINM